MKKIKTILFSIFSMVLICTNINIVQAETTANLNINENGRYRVKVTDNVGNSSYTDEFYIDNIDNVIPVIVASDNPDYWVNTALKINIEILDRESGINKIYLDDVSIPFTLNEEGGFLFSITVSNNCTHTIKVVDNVGNSITKEVIISKIDTIAPLLTASWSGSVSNRKLIIKAKDEASGINKILVNGATVDFTSGNDVFVEFTQDGSSKYVIRAYDAAGNTTSITQSASSEKLSKIEITKNPDKVEYVSGEVFNKTGMIVSATYVTGETEVLSDYNIINPNLLLGRKVVEISYTSGGITKSDSVNITVTKSNSSSNNGGDDNTDSDNGGGKSVNVTLGDMDTGNTNSTDTNSNITLGGISGNNSGLTTDSTNTGLGGIGGGNPGLTTGSTNTGLGGIGGSNFGLIAIINNEYLKNSDGVIYEVSSDLLKYIMSNITDAMINNSKYGVSGYGQGGFAANFVISGYNLDGSPIYSTNDEDVGINDKNSLWANGLRVFAKHPLLVILTMFLILLLILATILNFLYKNFLIQLLDDNKKLLGYRFLRKRNDMYYIKIRSEKIKYLQFPESAKDLQEVYITKKEDELIKLLDRNNIVKL